MRFGELKYQLQIFGNLGIDWTQLTLEFIIPNYIYSSYDHWNANGMVSGQLPYPSTINSIRIRLQAWSINNPAIAWVGDFEWYVNP